MYDGSLVFPSESGKNHLGSNILRAFKKILKNNKLPITNLHSLRHASASLLITAGASPKVVQERSGHSKVDTTLSIYTHLFQSEQDGAADVFERKLYQRNGVPENIEENVG